MSQSATRLNAIAAVRAKTMASRMSPSSRMVGQPSAATSIAPSAKGSAKTVCEKRMKRSASASIRSRLTSARFFRLVKDRRQPVIHAQIDQLLVLLRLVEIKAPAQGELFAQ